MTRKVWKGSLCFPLAVVGLVLTVSFSTRARQAVVTKDADLTRTAGFEEFPAQEDAGQQATADAASQALPQGEQKPGAVQKAQEDQAGPDPAAQSQEKQQGASQGPAKGAEASSGKPEEKEEPSKQQPKRILGVMPNFRAVTAGTVAPPPTAKQSFVLATQNSFDYSSFIFVGLTSAFAQWTNAHTQLGQGMTGYGRYYWRGLVDKTDGNYLVLFALPTVFHQDERYYARGKGGLGRRLAYASTRIFITPDYKGHDSFNISELLGRGIAQAISVSYYPSHTQTAGAIATKYGYAIMRDVLTSVFREFWPDIATHVLHRHP